MVVTKTITFIPMPVERLIEATLRQVISVGPWRLAVLDVRETRYIKTLKDGAWRYYKAPEDMKMVVIAVRVENAGMDIRYPFGFGELETPILVTDVNKSYDRVSIYRLDRVYEITREVEESAVEYRRKCINSATKVHSQLL